MNKPFRISVLTGILSFFCLVSQAQGLKIGYTRIDYIVSQTPESKQIAAQLTTQKEQAVTEINRMQKELQDKFAIYQKTGAQLTEVIRKDREAELQSLQTRIQEFNAKADESLQNKYRQLITPVLTKVQQTIDQVAKENGYTHVLNVGSGGSTDILYADEQYNVTKLVFKKLGITPGQTTTTTSPTSTKPTKAPVATPKPAPKKK